MKEQTQRRHTAAVKPSVPSPLAPAVRAGMQSGGQALDKNTQNTMSARFGHDFSSVRVHTDSHAAETAEAFGAHAFAAGSDIVFGEGRYAPGSSDGERLLAHELTHVVQQARGGPGDPNRASARADASEREADTLADQAVAGQSVQVQAAPQAALAREEEGNWFSSLASSAWGGTKAAAGAVYDGYEKATDFKALQSGTKDEKEIEKAKGQWGGGLVTGGLNGGIDWLEKKSAEGNQLMVDDSKGHWYEGLAKGTAWVNNGITQAVGGVTKGVLDVGLGVAGGIAHPIDFMAGIEGILEHNVTIPGLGTTLKAGHGLYDMATGKKDGEYGSSWGELGDHLFNPMTQMKDDAKFNTNLATSIIAPDRNKDGTTDWSAWKEKPTEAAFRAATNIAPFFLGMGEADAAKAAGAGDAAQGARAAEAGGAGQASRVKTLPGIGPDLPPPTQRGMPTMPGTGPGRTPTVPGMGEVGPPLSEPIPSTKPAPVDPLGKTDPALQAKPAPVDPLGKTDPAIQAKPPPAVDPAAVPDTGKTLVDPDMSKGAQPGMPWWDPAPPAESSWAKKLEWGLRQQQPGGLYYSEPLPAPPRVPKAPVPTEPAITRNPVQQMPVVDPAQMYPGAPPPPGWEAGPVRPTE